MADHNQVAITADPFGNADFAVEGGIHRRAFRIGKVNTLVPASVPVAEFG